MRALCAQDYARLHKFDVVAATSVADPTLDNMWNKVGWLLKVYQVRGAPLAGLPTCKRPLPVSAEAGMQEGVGEAGACDRGRYAEGWC